MTREEFNRQYQEGVTKAAVGVHIIIESGMDLCQINDDIRTLTTVLAEGIHLNVNAVRSDVMSAYRQLKPALEQMRLEIR